MSQLLLIISCQLFWFGLSVCEVLDIVLVGGVFDLLVGMLFFDDGVFQLVFGQYFVYLQQKDLQVNLQVLLMFGVDDFYVLVCSLCECGLVEECLVFVVEVFDDQVLCDLL